MCDNCSKEIAKQSFQLHYTYCVKNIKKCPYCKVPVMSKEMDEHIEEGKGNTESMKKAAEESDLEQLKKFVQHGAELNDFKDEE